MTVRLRVGKDLDGQSCEIPTSELGGATGGQSQLLSWLESQLGLELPDVSFTARMVAYLSCLRKYDNDGRFYNASLQKDEFGVASTLLQWRDTWFEAGWDGEGFDVDASMRLLDMGTVEDLTPGEVAPGIGERVQRVLKALDDIELDVSVTLLDKPDSFPMVWQKLFDKLGAVAEPYEPQPQCEGDSDLAVLQRALASERTPGKKVQLAGDGSVIVLRDGSPQLSSAWVARFAHEHLEKTGTVAVLAANDGTTLDDALNDAGYPRLGFSDTSFWRPAFQVLPLAIELIWRPLDPTVLLQFLTHSMGPIPRNIRRPLANVASRQPGIGGDRWLAAIEKALDKATAGEEGPAAQKKRADEAEKIEFWLNCERFDPQAGVDIGILRERAQGVSTWLSRAFAAQEDAEVKALYAAAIGHAEELVRTLDRLQESGTTVLQRESVRRLVEAVRGTGMSRPGRPRQCSSGEAQLLRADSPAAFLQPINNVVWWGCDQESFPRQYPWSISEQETLVKHGVRLLPLDTRLEWQARSWLRPILAAKERLVLVLHDNAESHHAVFDEIVAVAEGWAEERVDRLMRDSSLLPFADKLPKTQEIARRNMPPKKRWWQLPKDVSFAARDSESFTSLEKFLYAPHQWVLNYQARIKAGSLTELSDGSTLKGTLTHELFEDFFNAHADIGAIDAGDATDWAQRRIRELIEQKGAVLLMPGRQGEKEYFIATAVRALAELIRHLQAGNVVSVSMEEDLNGNFGGGVMGGSIDLLATNAAGENAVVDMKWGGFDYRRGSLAKSSYLQLGVYSQLSHQTLGRWPALGYFIIRDARMLLFDSDYFPDAFVVRPENGENYREFWQRVEATWQWRHTQIERGLIEVPVTGTDPDEDSSPGEMGLAMPDKFDTFDDYSVLAGWDEDA